MRASEAGVIEAIHELGRLYRQLIPGGSHIWSSGVYLVFKSRAERQKAEASGLTGDIAADLRRIAASYEVDPAEALRTIKFVDQDEINAAGGSYMFFK